MNIKKFTLLAASSALIVSSMFLLNETSKENYFPRSESIFSQQRQLNAGYVEHMNSIRNNRSTGFVSTEEIASATAQANKMKKSNKTLDITWRFKGPDNVGGRTRAVLVDLLDSNHIYAGGVSGGLWESFDDAVTWQPYGNFEISNVSAIAQGSDGKVYVGTGAGFDGGGNANASSSDAVGTGLYLLNGGGNATKLIGPLADFNFNVEWATINNIAVDPTNPDRVYVAMNRGIRTSDDGGLTWSNPLSTILEAQDVEIASDGRVYVSFLNSIVVTTDNFATSTSTPFSNNRRIEMAVAPSNPMVAYAAIAASNNCLRGVFKTFDGGMTWNLLQNTPDYFDVGVQCQGRYDNAIAVYPNDDGKIAVGGIFLFQWIQSSVDPAPIQGEWISIATNGGNNNFSNPFYIHSDIHAIAFNPNNPNKVYIGSDGGIGRSENFDGAMPTYGQNNFGYNITQFYDIGVGPNDQVIGGTQDNGTQLVGLGFNTGKSAFQVQGGDGFESELFTINPSLGLATLFNGRVNRMQGIGTTLGNSNFGSASIVSGRLATLCSGTSPLGTGCSNTFYTNVSKWESFNHRETNDSVLVLIGETSLPPIVSGTIIPYESKNNNIQLFDTLNTDLVPTDTSFARVNALDTLTIGFGSTGIVTFSNAFDTITVDTANMTIRFRYFGGRPAETVPFNYGIPVNYENVFYDRASIVPTAPPPLTITVSSDSTEVEYIDPKIVFNYRLELPDFVQSMVAIPNVRGPVDGTLREVWISRDVLKGGNVDEPRWVKIAGIASSQKAGSESTPVGSTTITSTFSPDGNHFYYGNTAGDLYRIDSLNTIDVSLIPVTASEDALINKFDTGNAIYGSVSNVRIARFAGGRAVTGIAIDPNNGDNMIVTLGNYGADQYVFRTTNATDTSSVVFESLMGDGASALPEVPVYEAIVDLGDKNRVLVATEIGIFGTDNAFTTDSIMNQFGQTVLNVNWTDESAGMGRARVMSLKQAVFGEEVGAINRGKVYAGTHGRGIYETGRFVGIEENVTFDTDKVKKNELKVYPNPAINDIALELNLITNENVRVEVYSITGKLVQEETLINMTLGLNTVNLDLERLSRGTYIIRAIQSGNATTAKFIKQ